MQLTKNLGLQIPDQDDIYDVDYVCYNMEIIDELMDLDNIEKAFNEVFFWYVPYMTIIEETCRITYIYLPENVTQNTGIVQEDYGIEMTAEEIQTVLCAEWDGEDLTYYDRCAQAAEEAYHIVFDNTTDNESMTSKEVLEAINTAWDGQASTDPAALSPVDIEEALSVMWDGQTSTDPTALSSAEIIDALKV